VIDGIGDSERESCTPPTLARILKLRSDSILGLKVTVAASVAASIGGVMGLSALASGGLMKNSIVKSVAVWCGVALLRRPGGLDSPIRESAL
jgi:hypothetical protein